MSPGGRAGRGEPWVGWGRVQGPCPLCSAQCEARPRPPPRPVLASALGHNMAEACRPGWAALTWMRKAGQDCGEGPQSCATHMDPAQAPRVPVGWGPCPQGRAVLTASPPAPSGRGIWSQGPRPGQPALTQCPTPALPHPGSSPPPSASSYASTHPPTHQLPSASQAACQELGPQDQMLAPALWGPVSRRGWGAETNRSGSHSCG